MAGVVSSVGKEFVQLHLSKELVEAAKGLGSLVEEDAYVGEVFSLGCGSIASARSRTIPAA